MALNDILTGIEKTTSEIKKNFPDNWKVKLENAKSITDMQLDDGDCKMKWHRYYLQNLRNQV